MASVLTLNRDIASGLEKIYIVWGNDGFLIKYAVNTVKSESVENEEWDLTVFDGGEISISEVIANCSYPSMTGRIKTVICYYPEIKTVSREGEIFKEYLKNPNPDVVLILVMQKLPENFISMEKYAHIVECNHLDKITIAEKFIPLFKDKFGCRIDSKGASLLADRCLNNLGRIEKEYEKLSAFKNYKDNITLDDVEIFVSPSMEDKVFAIAENLATGKYAKAFEITEGLIKIYNEKPYFVMAAVTSQYKRMLHIALNAEKSDFELAKILSVKEFAVKKSRSLSAKYTQKKLKSIFDRLTQAEYEFKSGQSGELNALYQCLLYICFV